MVRKFDQPEEALAVAHIVVNLSETERARSSFTIGIMSNDDAMARNMLNTTLGIPPVFHRRDELKMVEDRWRTDPDAVFRFVANLHSVTANHEGSETGGAVYELKFDLAPEAKSEFARGLGGWWGPGGQ